MNNLSTVIHMQEGDKKTHLEVSTAIVELLHNHSSKVWNELTHVLYVKKNHTDSHMQHILKVIGLFVVLWFFVLCFMTPMYTFMYVILLLPPTIQIWSFASLFKGWLSK